MNFNMVDKELEQFVDELLGLTHQEKFASPLLESIYNAMNNHYFVALTYKDVDGVQTFRDVVVYAYGLSLAGHPVIRAYMTSGTSTSNRTPFWRLFRLDRIKDFSVKKKTAKNINPHPLFNPMGDGSMSMVIKIAKY